jgi:FkbM family methyltransferase
MAGLFGLDERIVDIGSCSPWLRLVARHSSDKKDTDMAIQHLYTDTGCVYWIRTDLAIEFMTTRKKLAARLESTPLHALLRKTHRELTRYLDRAGNWNNIDPETNGEFFLLNQVAPRVRLALDIGANVGDWTSRLLQANPRCVVHGFEASPKTFANLRQRNSQTDNLVLYNCGMGENVGQLPFYDYGENSGLSSFVAREISVGLKPKQIINVPLTTVDTFRAEHNIGHVDFAKIDTEGFELPVLRGMRRTLQERNVSMIQFEYGGTWIDANATLGQANQFMAQLGYTLFRLRPDSLEHVNYHAREYETFKYANFVAVSSTALLQTWRIPHSNG